MWVTYRESDGYVVAITDTDPGTVGDGYAHAETDQFDPGDEFTYYIVVNTVADGQVTSHAAVRQSPPAQELLARTAGLEQSGQASKVAGRIAVVDKVRADELDDATVADLAPLFDPWEPDVTVDVGDVLAWDGTLVEALQSHTIQADWTPDVTPALWKVHRTDDGGPIAWQPGLALTTDDQVTYDGKLYDVVQAHTTQAGWEPPNLPSLFAEVTP